MSKKNIFEDQITVDGELYDYHVSHDYIVIREATGAPGYKRGWKHFKKFPKKDESAAQAEWKKMYDRRYVTAAVAVVKKGKIQPAVGFSIEASVQWHNAAQQHAQMAVICAARAGAELNRIKEQCDHGEWQEIVAQLPFSEETARKYRSLATEVESRMFELGGDVFDLLELPEPAQLSEPEYAEQLEQINQVTGEQTLRQLYFDWGITKQSKAEPKPLNLPKPKPLADGETQAHRDATELIYPLIAQLNRWVVSDERVVQHLTLQELKVLQGDLIDAKRIVDGLIKAG